MTPQIDSNRVETYEKSLSRMARCVVLHREINSESRPQGIKCIKRAQEAINTIGNRKSEG